MRYPVTIEYEGKKVTVKVNNKLLQGEFYLPDFLQTVRTTKGNTLQATHLMTDYLVQLCESYESGNERIPKGYLSMFTVAYNLPRKIIHLGYDPVAERKNILVERLKHLRLKENRSQSYIADAVGVSRGTYAKYETGINQPDLATLVKIADYFDVTLDYLAGRTN